MQQRLHEDCVYNMYISMHTSASMRDTSGLECKCAYIVVLCHQTTLKLVDISAHAKDAFDTSTLWYFKAKSADSFSRQISHTILI